MVRSLVKNNIPRAPPVAPLPKASKRRPVKDFIPCLRRPRARERRVRLHAQTLPQVVPIDEEGLEDLKTAMHLALPGGTGGPKPRRQALRPPEGTTPIRMHALTIPAADKPTTPGEAETPRSP